MISFVWCACVLLVISRAAEVNKFAQKLAEPVDEAIQTKDTAFVETEAQWRFGSNYVPQHYGNWKFQEGNWNFGNDRRIECEACGYNMYMLIDRLGDQFNHQTVTTEMTNLCPRVQWVFRSACEYITKLHGPKIINAVMRLTEPEDICKQLSYCSPSFYDAALRGTGMQPGLGAAGPAGLFQGIAGMGLAGMQGMPGIFGPGAPALGFGGAAHPYQYVPNMGYQTPYGNSMYPTPGTHPMNAHHPFSPYSFGGYDPYGYPYPHPGVPSATPPPPPPPKPAGEAAAPPA